MSKEPRRLRNRRPRLERLEARVVLSLPPGSDTYGLTPPANTIGLSLGDAPQPEAPSATTVTVSSHNLTPGKKTTEFGVFVQPYGNSGIVPRIVGVEENGKKLPFQLARTYDPRQAGTPSDQSVAFFETGTPGTVKILVAGRGLSTGQYTVETTLVGDVLGLGQVGIADEEAFATSYVERRNQKGYNAAADYNQNGIVNLYDALALERNMPAVSKKPNSGWVAINLAPQDEIHFASSHNSGPETYNQDITIEGYTTPGSLILVDGTLGNYKFNSQALSTNAQGFFSVKATNTQGINNYDFKILNPYGSQYIRDLPVFWIPYAQPDSKYVYKPSKRTGKFPGGGKI